MSKEGLRKQGSQHNSHSSPCPLGLHALPVATHHWPRTREGGKKLHEIRERGPPGSAQPAWPLLLKTPGMWQSWGLGYCSGVLTWNGGGSNPKKVSRDLIKGEKTQHTLTLCGNLLLNRIWVRSNACNNFIRTFLTRLGGKVPFMSTPSSHYYLSVSSVKEIGRQREKLLLLLQILAIASL